MARGLMALVSALLVFAFLWHLALTAACTADTGAVDAGVCEPEAGLCSSNRDCGPSRCDAGEGGTSMCPTHCTVGGFDSLGNTVLCCAHGTPPGTGDGGAPCMGPDDCATAVCAYEADYTTSVCSAYCNADS